MDPVTAVGLAGNIFGFIDFTFKLFASAKAIYESSSDASPSNQHFQDIARDIKKRCDDIKKDQNASPQLQKLANESIDIANELLDLIRRASPTMKSSKKISKKSKVDCFLAAIYNAAKKNELKELFDRLRNLQTQITTHLQDNLLAKNGCLAVELDKLNADLAIRGVEIVGQTTSIKDKIQVVSDAATERDREINRKLDHCVRFIQTLETYQTQWNMFTGKESLVGLMSILHVAGASNSLGSASEMIQSNLPTHIASLQMAADDVFLQHRLIRSLSVNFRELSVRELRIRKAHEETFKWALDQTREDIGFVKWLKSSNSIFWVRGKAGAGKSTLMKYILGQSETRQHLEHWANGDPLVIAKFFFWNAGTELQKSHEGLLRGLLVEMLKQDLNLVRQLTPEQLNLCNAAFESGAWDVECLSSILDSLLKNTPRTKYCFFIDGLDEFNDPLSTLLEILHSLSENRNLKMCVSSRPEAEFVNTFGRDTQRFLKVEDLTREDIERYITNKFEKSEVFQYVDLSESQYRKLVFEIAKKASGVFLWVHLMIPSLMEGIHHADSIVELRRRLDEVPADLEDLFVRMLQSIKQPYRTEAAQVFEMICVAKSKFGFPKGIPLLMFSALEEIREDFDWPLQSSINTLSNEELDKKLEKTKRHLGYYKGLLEVVVDPSIRRNRHHLEDHLPVDWLHRSVQDFMLHSTKARNALGIFEEKEQTALRLCRCFLGAAKWFWSRDRKDGRPVFGANNYGAETFAEMIRTYHHLLQGLDHNISNLDDIFTFGNDSLANAYHQLQRATKPAHFLSQGANHNTSNLDDLFALVDNWDQSLPPTGGPIHGKPYLLLLFFSRCCSCHLSNASQADISLLKSIGGEIWLWAASNEARKLLFNIGLDLEYKHSMNGRYFDRAPPVTVWEISLQTFITDIHSVAGNGRKQKQWGELDKRGINSILVCVEFGADPNLSTGALVWPDGTTDLEKSECCSARKLIEHYVEKYPDPLRELRDIKWKHPNATQEDGASTNTDPPQDTDIGNPNPHDSAVALPEQQSSSLTGRVLSWVASLRTWILESSSGTSGADG
ncbi:hypothetical protein F5Y16DRAFT_123668 [Xylariaceae sp. FL0255]|nr:hypothetical protein F5Y16DRAFT_123668 [Xylariaceae sp. FL0255]